MHSIYKPGNVFGPKKAEGTDVVPFSTFQLRCPTLPGKHSGIFVAIVNHNTAEPMNSIMEGKKRVSRQPERRNEE